MLQMLEPTTVKLSNVQSRVEKHGDEDVMSIDLAITWLTNNRSLTSIYKQLREALFCDMRQQADGAQEEMDLPVDELPNVRLPGMEYPVKLDFQQVGARVEVAYGIDEKTAIVLQLAKVHKFRVTPIEGGSAEVKFAVSSSADIDDHIIGTLSVLQQREISMMLKMPEVEPEKEKVLTPDDIFGPQGEPEKPLTPEDVFINDSKEATPAQKKADARGSKKAAAGRAVPLGRKIAAAERKARGR